MAGRMIPPPISVQVEAQRILTVRKAKYLGVWLDKNREITDHLMEVVKKAERSLSAFTRLMGNVGGPAASRRRMYAAVIDSTILYVASVWSLALKYGFCKRKAHFSPEEGGVEGVQRLSHPFC